MDLQSAECHFIRLRRKSGKLAALDLQSMAHVPETGNFNRPEKIRRRFLARLSCKSGTGFVA